MALINKTIALQITDRAARQYGKFIVGFTGISATSADYPSYFNAVTVTNDPDVEIPLESTFFNADATVNATTAFKSSMQQIYQVVTIMGSHFTRVGQSGGWDGYLTGQDVRVSDYFNQVNYAAVSQYLLANNVFSEGDDLFGTVTSNETASPVFVDGVSYGNGAVTNRATNGMYAASQLKVKVVGDCTSDFELEIIGKNKLNVTASVTVLVTGGTLDGTFVDVGTTSDRFLDVVSVSAIDLNYGTSGDVLEIYNKKERVINLDNTL